MKKIFFLFSILILILGCDVSYDDTELSKSVIYTHPNNEDINVDLDLDFAMGELSIAGNSTNLIEMTGKYNIEELKPVLVVKENDSFTKIDIDHGEDGSSKSFKKALSKWDLKLNSEKKITANIQSGMLKADFDFSQLEIEDLEIEAGTFRGSIKMMRKENPQKLTIAAGYCKFDLSLPIGVPTKISSSSGISRYNFDKYDKFTLLKNEQNQEKKTKGGLTTYTNYEEGTEPVITIVIGSGISRLTILPITI